MLNYLSIQRVWLSGYYAISTVTQLYILVSYHYYLPIVHSSGSAIQFYGQFPTSQYFKTTTTNLPYSTSNNFGTPTSQNRLANNFLSTGSRLPTRLISENFAKPRRFQKLISNSLDQDLEQVYGRSFKYELHPEEKLSLAFLD